jgi:hypothetical protein
MGNFCKQQFGKAMPERVVGPFVFPQLRSRNFYPCHPERHLATARSGSEVELKDPENVSAAMPQQGILPMICLA